MIKYFKKENTLGFTLIELLITITIIAVLSMIGMVAYTTFLKNARDAKRQSDLKFIQSALEQYHADQKYYPPLASDACPTTKGDGKFRLGCSLTDPSGKKIYLSTLPSDPTKNPDYSYAPSTDSANYCLFAKLEGVVPDSDAGCTDFSEERNYGVAKP